MTFGLVNLLGGSGSSGGTSQGSGSSETNSSNETSGTTGASGSTGGSSSEGSTRTETAQAVQPTPVSSPASKVDLGSERLATEQVTSYPITGPDEFAKSMAVRNQEAAKSDAVIETISTTPEVAEIGLDQDALRGKDDAKEADAAEDPAARDDAVDETDAPEAPRQSGFSPMTAAEEGEARLTA